MNAIFLAWAKDEVVIAACAMDHQNRVRTELPASWEAYVSYGFEFDGDHSSYAAKRYRLSLQIAAELTRSDSYPEILSESYAMLTAFNRNALIRLRDLGIIGLPFGVEATADMHFQLIMGAHYQANVARSVSPKTVGDVLRQGLAATAGLLQPPR
jgi:hypothetical protein